MLAQYRKGRKAKLTVGASWSNFSEEGPARQILFWSGGKDSFLALRALQRENKAGQDERITLLTTFERHSGTIPFQETQVADVLKQARHEGLDILVVPLAENTQDTGTVGSGRDAYAATVLEALKPLRVKGLAFGDLHLQDLRARREEAFAGVYPCRFPILDVPYEELMRNLWEEEGITVRVSSVSPEFALVEGLSVGRVYDQALVSDLPDDVDPMGERGEFHTHVHHHESERGGASIRRRRPRPLPSAAALD